MTAGTAGLIVFAMRGNYCAAGADWLRTHNGRVKTYELDEIKMHLHGNSVDLALRDSSGRRSSNKIVDLQANQDLWDLTHNGIRHSAARGAEINNYARGARHLGGAERERRGLSLVGSETAFWWMRAALGAEFSASGNTKMFAPPCE